MREYDRRDRLAPLPRALDPMVIDVPEPPQDRPARVIPIHVPRSRLHLSIPPDLPDFDPHAGEDHIARTLRRINAAQHWALGVGIAALCILVALLLSCAPAQAGLFGSGLGAAQISASVRERVDRSACIAGLTAERAQELMDWTAAAMGLETTTPPPILCAGEAELDVVYQAVGAGPDEPRLAGYQVIPGHVLINHRRRWPDGNAHLIVHEFCHHLHWVSGLTLALPPDTLELQCEEAHTRWLEKRKL